MRPTRITADIVQVPLRGASAFLLLGERVTIIDTGLPGSTPKLLAALRRLGRSVDEVEQVLITHYHLDHLGGLAQMLRHVPARAGIHALEAPAAQGDVPMPLPVRAPRALERLAQALPWPRRTPIDTWLHDGDELPVLGGLRVVHTPGHTPGHVSLLLPERGVLIAGDALARRRGLPALFGSGRSDARAQSWMNGDLTTPPRFLTSDWPAALRSIQRIATLEFETLALSHFPPIRENAAPALRRLARSLRPRP